MKKIIFSIACGVMLFAITACGTINYTENMKVVRENFNPWYLETNLNGGDLFDKALKRAKWDDENGKVTITGIDNKTGDKIEIVFKVEDETADFVSMKREDKKKDYVDFYNYMTNYIES